MRRRGLSLLEALMAGVILMLTVVGILSLVNQQPRAIAFSQDRQVAEMLLEELREAYGFLPLGTLSNLGFDSSSQGLDDLVETRFEDNPVVTFPDTLEDDAPPGRVALAKQIQRMDAKRGIYLDVEDLGSGLSRAVLTFRVGWTTPKGQARQIESYQVIYGPAGSP